MKAILLGIFALLATPFLRTNAGRDFQSRVMGDTASNGTGSYAAANYIALTENATAPAAGDTTLTSELAVEGLSRAQGVYAHTSGTTVYTITKTFTKSGGSTRSIAKAGMFNASSGGTMVFETLLPSLAVMEDTDQLTTTWTFNL